jgi:hypothetical protein
MHVSREILLEDLPKDLKKIEDEFNVKYTKGRWRWKSK